jgi:glycerol kinase
MKRDWGSHHIETVLRVDGGMAASDWTMQRLADITASPVDRSAILETTALGAAWLAGSRAGIWPGRQEFGQAWACDRRFRPAMEEPERQAKIIGWRNAVLRTVADVSPLQFGQTV